MKNNAGSGAIYGIGMLGALVYYLQHATSFVDGISEYLKLSSGRELSSIKSLSS
ncbi:MAG: hypothetical protein Q8Q49_06600 [bacterium]|nr:hypothetical protein [bacterium]